MKFKFLIILLFTALTILVYWFTSISHIHKGYIFQGREILIYSDFIPSPNQPFNTCDKENNGFLQLDPQNSKYKELRKNPDAKRKLDETGCVKVSFRYINLLTTYNKINNNSQSCEYPKLYIHTLEYLGPCLPK